jgi:hypothetical protein
MRYTLSFIVLGVGVCCVPPVLSADVVVDNSLNLTSLQVTASSGSVQLALTASAFGQVFDSLGGFDFGFDPGPVTASTSAATTLASWAGAADSTIDTAGSSSGVSIPGDLVANAGTVPGGTYGDLQGTLEIVDGSGLANPVTVDFLAALNGSQSLTTDADGVLATSEVTFNLVICCAPGSNTPTTELFYDSPLQIGPSSFLFDPISTTLTGSDTLLTNTSYFFDAQVDAESFGMNVPEPSSVWLLGTVCLIFLACRLWRARPVQR